MTSDTHSPETKSTQPTSKFHLPSTKLRLIFLLGVIPAVLICILALNLLGIIGVSTLHSSGKIVVQSQQGESLEVLDVAFYDNSLNLFGMSIVTCSNRCIYQKNGQVDCSYVSSEDCSKLDIYHVVSYALLATIIGIAWYFILYLFGQKLWRKNGTASQ